MKNAPKAFGPELFVVGFLEGVLSHRSDTSTITICDEDGEPMNAFWLQDELLPGRYRVTVERDPE